MMMNYKKKAKNILMYILTVVVIFSALSFYLANAIPQGATLSGTPAVDSGPNQTASSRTDPGGKIVTVNFNLEQQDYSWKAYVGNISGTYVLKNSYNYSIYEWPLGASISGELYMSRSSAVNFTTGAISCASDAEMTTEQSFFGMAAAATDNINNTFNATSHNDFSVGYNDIPENNCSSIALWVNDTQQTPSSSAIFQEVTLHDGTNLVYASLINNDQTGFDNRTTFDFQAIVAENRSSATGTSYYFYIELG